MGGEKGSNFRPGDWICPSCGNHNYASKVACNKCGMPKAADMQSQILTSVAQAWMGQQGWGGGVSTSGQQMRPGDWECKACGNVNYASREVCNKCGVPKSTYISKTG